MEIERDESGRPVDEAHWDVDDTLSAINELLRAKGKNEWVLKPMKGHRSSSYALLTVDNEPVNPVWGRRFYSYKKIRESLSLAYALLKDWA